MKFSSKHSLNTNMKNITVFFTCTKFIHNLFTLTLFYGSRIVPGKKYILSGGRHLLCGGRHLIYLAAATYYVAAAI